MVKNCVLDHSVTHSLRLFDALRTKAFASEYYTASIRTVGHLVFRLFVDDGLTLQF